MSLHLSASRTRIAFSSYPKPSELPTAEGRKAGTPKRQKHKSRKCTWTRLKTVESAQTGGRLR